MWNHQVFHLMHHPKGLRQFQLFRHLAIRHHHQQEADQFHHELHHHHMLSINLLCLHKICYYRPELRLLFHCQRHLHQQQRYKSHLLVMI
jgi:hypothetical protein